MNPGNPGGDAGERPERLVEEMGAGRRSTDSMIPPTADWSPFTVSPTVRLPPPPPEGRSVHCGFLTVGGWQTGGRGRDGWEKGVLEAPLCSVTRVPFPLPAPCAGFGGGGTRGDPRGRVEGGWIPTPPLPSRVWSIERAPHSQAGGLAKEGRCGGWWSEDGWGG